MRSGLVFPSLEWSCSSRLARRDVSNYDFVDQVSSWHYPRCLSLCIACFEGHSRLSGFNVLLGFDSLRAMLSYALPMLCLDLQSISSLLAQISSLCTCCLVNICAPILSLFPPLLPLPPCTLSRPSASCHDASTSSGSSSSTQNVVGEGRELLSQLKYGNLNNYDFILAYGFGRRSD